MSPRRSRHESEVLTSVDLAAFHLFEGVSEQDLDALAAQSRPRSCRAGAVLRVQNELEGRIGLVASGRFHFQCCKPTSRLLIAATHTRGDLIGYAAALSGAQHDEEARLLCDRAGTIILMPASALLELAARAPPFASTVARRLADAALLAERRLVELGTLSVAERLELYLSRLRAEGDNAEEGIDAPTHAVIAASIGASREAVSRHLAKLEQIGAIECARRSIKINALPTRQKGPHVGIRS